MKTDAIKQLEAVSISQVKEILKRIVPDRYDKMIISDNQTTERGNYVYSKLDYQAVERQVERIRFPLYDQIKDQFSEFEGGRAKFGEKAMVNSATIFERLKRDHNISGEGLHVSDFNDPFNFPLETINNEISKDQKIYFLPEHTFQETCDECRGAKYVKCPEDECGGRHRWTCTECHGDGKITCSKCGGDGKVSCPSCKGLGRVKCGGGAGNFMLRHTIGNVAGGGCGGTGWVKDSNEPGGQRICKTCRGRGEVPCEECGSKGEVRCDSCQGRGQIQCSVCSGKGEITCGTCYGDKERYGMVDCPQCETVGIMANITYVNTFVNNTSYEKVFCKGIDLSLQESKILSHVSSKPKMGVVYRNVNNNVFSEYDEFSQQYAKDMEKELGLNKGDFPLLTHEAIYYKIIPCLRLSYTHMLTNTSHNFTIIDIWDNPEVIFHSEPETLKQDLGNMTKSMSGFFGKVFKTKGFKTKEDRMKEITLLIYLAKADGKIEEEEKTFLSTTIGSLEDFTNSEKQHLFDIMNATTLPELTRESVQFSTRERANEAIQRLTELAMADGDFAPQEKALIERIKSLI